MNNLTTRESELVALGAAMGNNCVPFVEHHIPESRKVGITDREFSEPLDRLGEHAMYTDEREQYIIRARRMRSEYIAQLMREGIVALLHVIRWTRRAAAHGLRSAAQIVEPRHHRAAV